MSRDYAKKPPRPKYPAIPGWVWLSSGLIVGLFVALLVYLDQQPAEPIKMPNFQTPGMQDTRDVKKDAAEPPGPPSPPKPRFEFYNILPEFEVAVPDEEIDPLRQSKPAATEPVKATAPATGADPQYLLQAGSFKQFKEADGFKAHLALLGLEADIQSATINGAEWHRVRLGPFTDVEALNRARARLDEHDIRALVVKIKD